MPNRVGGCYEFRRNSGFLQETSFRFGLKNRRNWPLSAGIYRNFESERNFLIFRGSNSFQRNRNKHPRGKRERCILFSLVPFVSKLFQCLLYVSRHTQVDLSFFVVLVDCYAYVSSCRPISCDLVVVFQCRLQV